LGIFESSNKLSSPLGKWVVSTHQRWHWFLDPITDAIIDVFATIHKIYYPLTSRGGQHLRSGHWYDFNHNQEQLSIPENIIPVTINHCHTHTGALFQVSRSPNSIPSPTADALPLKDRAYYANLLPSLPDVPWQTIIGATVKGNLHVCTYILGSKAGESIVSWQFSSSLVDYSGTGPLLPGTSRYRAELYSILTSLYILY